MKRCLVAALFVCAPALAAPPREAVERLLGGYEPRPVAAALKRLGEGTDQVLIEIARDPRAPRLRRLRALAALAHVPTAAGRELCRAVIRDEAQVAEGLEVSEVAACAGTLGAFGPSSQGELLPLLAHPAPDVRAAAARALAVAHVTAAAANVRQRLAVEPDAATRTALVGALRELERK